MILIETERLILRTWEPDDAQLLADLSSDPVVMQYFPALQSRDAVESLVARIDEHFEHYGYTLYAVELKSTHEFIGFTGLMTVPFDAHFTPAVEIGWRLAKAYWNQGYATEAAKAVLDMAFNLYQLDEVVSFTAVSNTPSKRVMEKIGLVHNPEDDFWHPKLAKDHALSRHVLYRLSKAAYHRMNNNICIRQMISKDIKTVFDIRDSVKENYMSREAAAKLGFTEQSLKEMLNADCYGWVAVMDGIPVGFSVVDKSDAKILGLFVRSEAEGHGLGRRLLSVAEAFLIRAGIKEAWLTTSADKGLRAHRFYEKMGWIITEELPNDQVKYVKRF